MNGSGDRTVLEAASWRLASELVRRNPETLRLIRAHPGGGQSDCLWLLPRHGAPGDVRLNRAGTIQVLERFDGRPGEWSATGWHDYLDADPREFLGRLESAAGLPSPSTVPASTRRTLTLRVLAAIAATAFKTVHPIDIEPGYIDTSGYDGGPNEQLDAFTVPAELKRPRPDDFYEQPGYRFWVVKRDETPILALEQDAGLAWTTHNDTSWNLLDLYTESRRHLLVTALKLLRLVDHV